MMRFGLVVLLVGMVELVFGAEGGGEVGETDASWSRCPHWDADTAIAEVLGGIECTFFVETGAGSHLYDLRPACNRSGDYVSGLNGDGEGNQFYLNVCANVTEQSSCFPQDREPNVYAHGAAVVFPSDEKNPVCNHKNPACVDPESGKAVCCTRDCAALGLRTPTWKLMDRTDPWRGGVVGTFPIQPFGSIGGGFCGSNRDKKYQWRRLVYEIQCAYGSTSTTFVEVKHEPTEEKVAGVKGVPVCKDVAVFQSFTGCEVSRLSPGWIFVCLLMLATLGYVLCFSVATLVLTGRLHYPHHRWWGQRFSDVRLGLRILTNPVKQAMCPKKKKGR